MQDEAPLGDVQQMWYARTQAPEVIVRPSCYDRPAFVTAVRSSEFFGVVYDFRQSGDCPHWRPGGNAEVTHWCHSAGGVHLPWSACSGCRWKTDRR